MHLRAIILFAKPYRLRLLLTGVLMLASSIATLALPWLAGRLVGGIVLSGPWNPDPLVMGLTALLALIALLNFAVAAISGTTSARLLADLRVRIFEHLEHLPLEYHENHRQGDTLALMTYEIAHLGHFLTGTLVNIPPLLLTVAGAIFLMFRIDVRLALLPPLLVPAFYLVLKVVGRRLRRLARELQEAEAGVVTIAEESLEMLPALKSDAREEIEASRYRAQVAKAMDLTQQESLIQAGLDPLLGLVASCGGVLFVFMAGRHAQGGQMAPADLFSFLFYVALLTRPVGSLANVYGQLQTTRGTLARLQAVMGRSAEPGYAGRKRLGEVAGAIAFENVSFAYPGREATLRQVDFTVQPGQIVALTGLNGAGKSTIGNLLVRFYDPQAGTIRLDGVDIAELDVRDLRQQIGLVPQRPLLFNGTIRANIAWGREGASDEDVEAAARKAQAHDFVCALPDVYDTEIGDHGVRLSGGQRQRIALARAFVKDPPILILDEATSMYDLEGEGAFVERCHEALHGRTVILITHRPASLALADRVLTLENGQMMGLLSG